MMGESFNVQAWLRRIGHTGPVTPDLVTLRALIAAHSGTIPFENVDVLLGRVPRLDLESLQNKIILSGRGGYCFEQNAVFRAGLRALEFRVTSLIARVISGMAPDEVNRPATHMVLRVDLPEGPFLADVGFGNLTPTTALAMRPDIAQETPHETMRLLAVGDELALQAHIGDAWQSVYRLSPRPALDSDYAVANWFTATHVASPFIANMIVARPGPDGQRHTLVNGRLTTRKRDGKPERHMLEGPDAHARALPARFGLLLSDDDLHAALAALRRHGTLGAESPFFR